MLNLAIELGHEAQLYEQQHGGQLQQELHGQGSTGITYLLQHPGKPYCAGFIPLPGLWPRKSSLDDLSQGSSPISTGKEPNKFYLFLAFYFYLFLI